MPSDYRVSTESTDTSPPITQLKASEFKPETRAALKEQGLDESSIVLDDNTGGKAEAAVQTILKSEGLPTGDGQTLPLQEVVPGQYAGPNGIDLIGVTAEGNPLVIEVKKRASTTDSMGQDSVPLANLEPETLALREQILKERALNPVL